MIQEVLCWDPNDGPATLPERGEVGQNKEGHNVDIPDWDEHVDSLVNKGWVDWMTVIVAGCIEVSISSAT
jgi:hypothetical protein